MQIAERIYLLRREQLPTNLFLRQQTEGQVRPCPSSSPSPPASPTSLRDENSSSGQEVLCLEPPWVSHSSMDIQSLSPLRAATAGFPVSGSHFLWLCSRVLPMLLTLLAVLEVSPLVASSPSSPFKMKSCPNRICLCFVGL